MPVVVSTGGAAVAAASASAAAAVTASNNARHRAECEKIDSGFVSATATIEQKHEYAACINYIYPSGGGAAEFITISVLAIALALKRLYA